jgi:hypothetical protein
MGQQTHPVELDMTDFCAVWVSPEVPQEYRNAVTRRLPGLNKDRITAFSTTSQKFKPKVDILSWSTSYYFVWKITNIYSIPEELPNHRLSDRGSWHCSLISLPDEGDPKLLAWLRQATGLNVLREKRRWSIIYPIAYDVDIGGRIQVPPSNSLYLGTFPDLKEDQGSSFEVAVGETRGAAVTLGGGWRFIEVTVDASLRSSTLRLNWDHRSLPEIARVPFLESHEPAVLFEFRAKNGGISCQAALHQASCRAALEKIRTGELEIARASLPSTVKGHLRWRRPRTFKFESLAIPADPAMDDPGRAEVVLPPILVSAINTSLRDAALEVQLDFGAFGSFHAVAVEPAARSAPEFALQPGTRRQIVWFCKASGAYQTIAREPVDRLNDDELVEHFVSIRAASWLATHKRSIERAITDARWRR